MQQVNSCSQPPVYRAGCMLSHPAKKKKKIKKLIITCQNNRQTSVEFGYINLANLLISSICHCVNHGYFFHLAALVTCYVEHMQYHHVKEGQNLLELSELELELKRFTKYRDIIRNIKKDVVVQLSSEKTKLKGGLFLLLLQL